jgi:hypothetical protein
VRRLRFLILAGDFGRGLTVRLRGAIAATSRRAAGFL